MPACIRSFHIHRLHLYAVDGVAIYKDRVIIPTSLQADSLRFLHSAHQGTTLMQSKTDACVFWPGIAADISNHRLSCPKCNTMSPSQASLPPTPPILPTRPFQRDFFTHKGHHYVVIVDCFSRWPIVERSTHGATGLVSVLCSTFVTFGIPDDITTDGGSEFTATVTKIFLTNWGVHHRLCSVANPHSNSRAEIGVKTVKRALAGNTPDNGDLDCDTFQRAMLTYRNTPDPITKISPAIAVFARPIQDLIPVLPGKLRLHQYWDRLLDDRETTMASRGDTEHEKWSEHTRTLPQLKVGDHVRVQNQTGPFPRRWDKTGTIVQVQQFHQYWVRMSGSGRASLRNRKFLRKCAALQPSVAKMPIPGAPLHPPKPPPTQEPLHITDENDSDVVTWDTPSMESPPSPRITLETPPTPRTDPPAIPSPPPHSSIYTRSTRRCVLHHRPDYKD